MNEDEIKKYVFEFKKAMKEVNDDIARKQIELLGHLSIIASTLLGALVALYKNNDHTLLVRYVFVALVASLSMSILAALMSLYSQLHYRRRAKMIFEKAKIEGLKEDAPKVVNAVVQPLKILELCEPIALICFALSTLVLLLYASLLSFS